MKALRKLTDGIGNVDLVDVAEPIPKKGEVLVEVKRAGICGTDIHILHGRFPKVRPPVTLGHEFCGVVAKLGSDVHGLKIGDRVTSETAASSCNTCVYCKAGQTQLCDERVAYGYGTNGAFTSYVTVRHDALHVLPDHISFREAALSEPLAVAAHVVLERSTLKSGDLVLVTGPGTIGLLVFQVAKAMGARVAITGVQRDTDRLEIAARLGAEYCVRADNQDVKSVIADFTDGYGVDVAFECTGNRFAVNDCINNTRKGGEIVQVGLLGSSIELDYDSITLKEINLRGSFAHHGASWDKAIDLMRDKKVDLNILVSGEFPLVQWKQGFDLFERGNGLKYLLYPGE